MEWNAESVLDALNDFERKTEIPEILDQYLERIAKNGEIVFPWNKLKPLLKKKLEVVLDEFYETCPVETSVPVPNFETFNFDNLKKTILQAVEAFTSAPFTIQRLCELVTNPTKHYNRTDKYMRGIEKNVLVVSTIEPRSEQDNNPVVVNGLLRDDNDTLNGHSVSSSNNLNTASNHVLLENFANVFPSAACIPPSSNVCDSEDNNSSNVCDGEDNNSSNICEEDNNFMSEENTEEELVPVEQIVSSKDEEMDTTEDEKEQPVSSEETTEDNTTRVQESDSDSTRTEVRNEADSSEDLVSTDLREKETCQQDDTVSQSDEVGKESEVTDEVVDYINDVPEDIKLDDYIDNVVDVIGKVADEIALPPQEDSQVEATVSDANVSESDSTSEPSAMDLESTSSEELDPPV